MTETSPLTLVDEDYAKARRVYVLGLDEYEMCDQMANLQAQGNVVINREADPVEHLTLREHLAQMLGANTVGVPDAWWSSAVTHQLMTVAGWLGMDYVDERGRILPKANVG